MTAFLVMAARLFQGDPVEALLVRCEEAEGRRGSLSASLTACIEDRRNESRRSLSGRLVLRVSQEGGRSLLVELREERSRARPLRAEIGEGGAEPFHPFEILRRGAGRWLRERFEATIGDPPEGGLPPFVRDPEGRPLEPRRAAPSGRRGGRRHAAAPEEGPPGGVPICLDLVPRREGLRSQGLRLRIWLEPDSLSVVGLDLDLPDRRETYHVDVPRQGLEPAGAGSGRSAGREGDP